MKYLFIYYLFILHHDNIVMKFKDIFSQNSPCCNAKKQQQYFSNEYLPDTIIFNLQSAYIKFSK